jgi:hypothetical protein
VLVDGLTITAIASGSGDEAGIAATANLRLMGFSVKESAGAAATAVLRHGGTGGVDTVFINLATAGSDTQWFGPQGIPMPSGVWIERLTGSCAITLYTKIVT